LPATHKGDKADADPAQQSEASRRRDERLKELADIFICMFLESLKTRGNSLPKETEYQHVYTRLPQDLVNIPSADSILTI
jgi:hypothetical protein